MLTISKQVCYIITSLHNITLVVSTVIIPGINSYFV